MLAGIAFISACASSGPTYTEQVMNRPLPKTEEQRQQECGYIRSEMARQRGLASAGSAMATSPMQAALYQAATGRNIAALESRAANIRCTAAFSNAAPEARIQDSGGRSNMTLDECIAKCKQYTERTNEQCFDSCNK